MNLRSLRLRPKMLHWLSDARHPQSKVRFLFTKVIDYIYNDEPVYEVHVWRFK